MGQMIKLLESVCLSVCLSVTVSVILTIAILTESLNFDETLHHSSEPEK